jgi:hypothetical protein
MHLIGFFYFTDQSGTLFTNWLVNSNMSLRTSQRTCELRNEVRNICGQSFVKSTVKSSPGWGIVHSQLAQGLCISLQVVSRHPGIYTIISNQIKCPGVFPGGGMVTPGIDSCITLVARGSVNSSHDSCRDALMAALLQTKLISNNPHWVLCTYQCKPRGGGGGGAGTVLGVWSQNSSPPWDIF